MVRLLIASVLTPLLCLSFPGGVTGGGCGSYSAGYVQQYVQQYVQPAYVAPVYNAVVTPNYYYQTQDYYRESLLADAIAGKLYQLQTQQQQYQQQQYQQAPQYVQPQQQQYQQRQQYQQQSYPQQQQAPCPTCPPPAQQQQPLPQQQQQPPATDQPRVNYGPAPNGLQRLMDQRCVFCHDGGDGIDDPKKSQRLDLRNIELIPPGMRWYAYGLVKSGEMPQRRAPLAKEEVDMVLQWALSAGATTAQQ